MQPSCRARVILRAIVLRVVLWGGLAALAIGYVFDFGGRASLTGGRPSENVRTSSSNSPYWPHLRGPDYRGVSPETELADHWPTEGPPLVWRADLGRGYSGFTVVDGRAFTQEQTFTDQRVVALDAASGQRLWEHRYDWPYEPAGLYPGSRATPTWHNGNVYFASPDGLVGALDAATGQLVWSVNVNKKFGGRGTDFGYSCSPLVEDGKVVIPVGGEAAAVVALDAGDGSTVWASGNEPASYCSALPITVDGHRQAVAFLQNVLVGFDLRSGQLLWKVPYSVGYDEHAAMPLYQEQGSYLLASMPFQAGADVYRLNKTTRRAEQPNAADPPYTAQLVRHIGELSNDVASSVLLDGHVYGFDLREVQAKAHRPSRGNFRCIELASGKVRWSTDRTGHASLIAADGKLYLFNDRGEMILARAGADQYEELGRVQVFAGEICWTAPALAGGKLYLRSPTRAACLHVGKPERLDEADRARSRRASEEADVAPVDWTWLVGGERDYPADPPDAAELGLWYAWSLMGILLAAVAAWISGWFVRASRRNPARLAIFVFLGVLWGVLATPLCNRIGSSFVFTWPVILFIAQQIAIVAILWSKGRSGRRALLAAVAVVAFIVVCLAYVDLCRRTNLVPAWVFLLGFLPSWPLSVPAARRLLHSGHTVWHFAWFLFSFSLYYWSAAVVMLLRTYCCLR